MSDVRQVSQPGQEKKLLMDRQNHVHTQARITYRLSNTFSCAAKTSLIDLYLRKWIRHMACERTRKLCELFSKSAPWSVGCWWFVATHTRPRMCRCERIRNVYSIQSGVAPITHHKIFAYSWRLSARSRIQRTTKPETYWHMPRMNFHFL